MSHEPVAEVRVLPEVIDFSLITDMAGALALAFTIFGASMYSEIRWCVIWLLA